MTPVPHGERPVGRASDRAPELRALKPAFQQIVLRTANGPLAPLYDGIYRAPAR